MAAAPARVVLAGPQPGHRLLLSRLYEYIRAGTWAPNQQIPSERELCEQYGVSRSLVRQALQQAEIQGLLVRVPGKGTFVAQPKVRQELHQLNTYQATLLERSMRPGRRVLSSVWRPAPAEIAARLGIAADEPVLELDTLALGDGSPMALFQSHLPGAVGEHVAAAIESPDAEAPTTYELALEALGSPGPIMADQTFESVPLDVYAGHLLTVPAGSAAFRITSLFHLAGGQALEHRVSLYPGSRYSFHIVREVASHS